MSMTPSPFRLRPPPFNNMSPRPAILHREVAAAATREVRNAACTASRKGAAHAGRATAGMLRRMCGSGGLLPGQWPGLLLRGRRRVPVLRHRDVQGSADVRRNAAVFPAPAAGEP
jgi:hypothetical protein